jgi:hypothetical protein
MYATVLSRKLCYCLNFPFLHVNNFTFSGYHFRLCYDNFFIPCDLNYRIMDCRYSAFQPIMFEDGSNGELLNFGLPPS